MGPAPPRCPRHGTRNRRRRRTRCSTRSSRGVPHSHRCASRSPQPDHPGCGKSMTTPSARAPGRAPSEPLSPLVNCHGYPQIALRSELASMGRKAPTKGRETQLQMGNSSSDLVTKFVSVDVARRRASTRVPQMCPECVRALRRQTTTKCRFTGTLCNPAHGLEPSTPSLPWNLRGNRWQPTATVFACFSRFRSLPMARLSAVATALLPKCSIPL
jgi:hypothetical protein